jgi:hypothetical protein
LRDRDKEYKRRSVQPLVVFAQQAFQLKRPRVTDKRWAWPGDAPVPVLFDPAATVSATYGVAFQNRFRDGPWSNRPTVFVIDRAGVIRHVASRPDRDIPEVEVFEALGELEEQRRLITLLRTRGDGGQEAARVVLGPVGPHTRKVVPTLVKCLTDEDRQVRAGAAAALLWIGPRAKGAIPALRAALKDKDRHVRRLAALALERCGAGARARSR